MLVYKSENVKGAGWHVTHLLYNTMSGSQISLAGTYSLSTPPYSRGSQDSLKSVHSLLA